MEIKFKPIGVVQRPVMLSSKTRVVGAKAGVGRASVERIFGSEAGAGGQNALAG
jgi:hypothetical protein